jgi:hypothetical protein
MHPRAAGDQVGGAEARMLSTMLAMW